MPIHVPALPARDAVRRRRRSRTLASSANAAARTMPGLIARRGHAPKPEAGSDVSPRGRRVRRARRSSLAATRRRACAGSATAQTAASCSPRASPASCADARTRDDRRNLAAAGATRPRSTRRGDGLRERERARGGRRRRRASLRGRFRGSARSREKNSFTVSWRASGSAASARLMLRVEDARSGRRAIASSGGERLARLRELRARPVQDARDDEQRVLALAVRERRLAGEHLDDDRREREHVGARR